VITTRDLMDRYNIKTRQGIIQFVKKHLDEINHDGEEHATMQKGEWAFDTEAVRILDQLRGLHDQATITELESEKVSNAQQESHNLRILLLKAQQDLNTAQQQVITLQQNLIAKQNELSEVKVKALEAQQNKDQADALQSELDRLKKEGSIIEDEHKQLQETLSRPNETACASSWPKKTTAIGGNSGSKDACARAHRFLFLSPYSVAA
jgi:predicted  nucleic acid-binding Zn-ribbon protein